MSDVEYLPIGFGPAPQFTPISFGPAPEFPPIKINLEASVINPQ